MAISRRVSPHGNGDGDGVGFMNGTGATVRARAGSVQVLLFSHSIMSASTRDMRARGTSLIYSSMFDCM